MAESQQINHKNIENTEDEELAKPNNKLCNCNCHQPQPTHQMEIIDIDPTLIEKRKV